MRVEHLDHKDNDQSATRNSSLRSLTEPLNYPVRLFHQTFPQVKATHVTIAGVLASVTGIHLMEHQHRSGKHSLKTTSIAIGLMLAGMGCDLLDGKLARLIRSEMVDKEQYREDEKRGQLYDPMADGVIEAAQLLESAYTSYRLGHPRRVRAALFNLATSNLPRTCKAIAGFFGKTVPETFRPSDIRFFGTSLGRKLPNYAATILGNAGGLNVQEFLSTACGIANIVVSGERLSAILRASSNPPLSPKDIDMAGFRAKYLGIQSLANIGVALIVSRILKTDSNSQSFGVLGL